jgi:hypothetical protein
VLTIRGGVSWVRLEITGSAQDSVIRISYPGVLKGRASAGRKNTAAHTLAHNNNNG